MKDTNLVVCDAQSDEHEEDNSKQNIIDIFMTNIGIGNVGNRLRHII